MVQVVEMAEFVDDDVVDDRLLGNVKLVEERSFDVRTSPSRYGYHRQGRHFSIHAPAWGATKH